MNINLDSTVSLEFTCQKPKNDRQREKSRLASEAFNFSCLLQTAYKWIHSLVGKIVVVSQSNKVNKVCKKFFEDGLQSKSIKITTEHGVCLEAMHLMGKNAKKDGPTVILMNPNAALMHDLRSHASWYQNEGFNVVLFNYRGTGESTGSTTRDGLLLDGEAVYEFVKSLTEDDSKIVIHGHSLGGAIAAHVAAKNPGSHLLHDRSFSTLCKTINTLIFRPLGYLASALCWDFDAADNFKKITGKRWVIHASDDAIIKKPAGLFHYVKEQNEKNQEKIRIDKTFEITRFMLENGPFLLSPDDPHLGHYAHCISIPDEIKKDLIQELKKATGLSV